MTSSTTFSERYGSKSDAHLMFTMQGLNFLIALRPRGRAPFRPSIDALPVHPL